MRIASGGVHVRQANRAGAGEEGAGAAFGRKEGNTVQHARETKGGVVFSLAFAIDWCILVL